MFGKILVEVCCGSVDDAIEAEKGGAGRVELNSCILLGGLTPSLGSLIEAKRVLRIPVAAMVRPRGGGFCYTEAEFETMKNDTRLFAENGADAVVFGILEPDGNIDAERCREIIRNAKGKDIVFHRAFDVTPDPFKAIDTLIGLGVKRVLTAGQENTPVEGAALIKKLAEYAGGRIEILPGGATPWNVADIVREMGCTQLHMASFITKYDTSVAGKPHIYFGLSLRPMEDRYDITDRNTVKTVKQKAESVLGEI